MTIICGGISFEQAPLEVREKVAFDSGQLPDALRAIRSELRLRETVLVSTCNRVEYFGFATEIDRAEKNWLPFLREFHGLERDSALPSFHLKGAACVEHLYQLASGLKSMVIGETEILGQLKQAYAVAQAHTTTGKWMNKLFQSSFAAAKAVRSQTQITKGGISVSAVAVELAEKIFGSLEKSAVLVIGSGDTGQKTAKSLRSRGVGTLYVANRTYERAADLASKLGGEPLYWDKWEEAIALTDIIVSSTSSSHYVLTAQKLETALKHRNGRPLFLIDLAVPRDFEPSINLLDDVYLYDIDDLQSIAQKHIADRQNEIARGMDILKPYVSKYCQWAASQPERVLF
jgi:glutamyl-tRNA reductase